METVHFLYRFSEAILRVSIFSTPLSLNDSENVSESISFRVFTVSVVFSIVGKPCVSLGSTVLSNLDKTVGDSSALNCFNLDICTSLSFSARSFFALSLITFLHSLAILHIHWFVVPFRPH